MENLQRMTFSQSFKELSAWSKKPIKCISRFWRQKSFVKLVMLTIWATMNSIELQSLKNLSHWLSTTLNFADDIGIHMMHMDHVNSRILLLRTLTKNVDD